MSSNKDFRSKNNFNEADDLRKGTKLSPIKKSGKERHAMYSDLDENEDEVDFLLESKKESVLDYFDDGEDEL